MGEPGTLPSGTLSAGFGCVMAILSHFTHIKDIKTLVRTKNLSESMCFIYTALTGTEQNSGEFPFSLGHHPTGNSTATQY